MSTNATELILKKGETTTRKPCVVFRLNGGRMFIELLSLPVIAVIFVLTVSLAKDFAESTSTDCGITVAIPRYFKNGADRTLHIHRSIDVWNYLPSISATIGCCTPQRYVWQVLISLHMAPRIMIALMYYNHYMSFPVTRRRGLYQVVVTTTSAVHMMENGSLLLLSCVTSEENFEIHKTGFIGFVACSIVYMILTLVVFHWSRETADWSEKDLKSYRQKKMLFLFNIATFIVSIYFYHRHNQYCESGVYSLFAFLEYLVVISNIAFHATAIYEYGQGELVFSEVPISELGRHHRSTFRSGR